MAENRVDFTINIGGNAYKGSAALDAAMGKLNITASKTTPLFDKIGVAAVKLNSIFQLTKSVVGSVTNAFNNCVQANQAQQEAETKLARVMRNTMAASDEQIESIKALTSAQQALGIVGDEVQLAGAQELGTYLEKTESLQKLIPVMNDMVAQQYGYNATQESAVNIATMMGKVMEGQVGALSRYGYKFDEAQEKILKYGTEAEKVATLAEVITESVGGMNAALAATPEGKMKQMANRVGDLQERIGRLFVQIKTGFAPVADMFVSIAERIMAYVESKREQILNVVSNVVGFFKDNMNVFSAVASVAMAVVATAFNVATTAIKAITTALSAVIEFAQNCPVVFWTLAGAITAVAVAMNAAKISAIAQEVALNALIIKEQLATLWTNALSMAVKTFDKGKGILSATAKVVGLGVSAIASGAAFAAMKNVAVSACRSISAAIMAIPIVGWIAAGITAVIAAIKLLWDKCEGFRVLVMGVWEVVKAGAVFAWTLIKAFFAYIWLRITSLVDTVVGVFTTIKEAVGAAAQWVRDTIITPVVEWFNGVGDSVLSVVDRIRTATGGAFDWVRTKIFKPITDFFSNLYDNYVKPALDKIVGFMAKIFNPIIKLWNRLTGAAVEAFGTGAQKGHASWLADHSDGGASGGTNQSLAEAVNAPLRAATKGSAATGISNATAQGTEAVATGGSKQTTVNISLGKFFENIVYNEGGAADNASDTERRFVEIMNRVLGMAAMAV